MCNYPSNNRSTLYNRLFAHFYDSFMAETERKILLPRRKRLLQDLRGKILEVGAGTGINFPLYPPEADVLAIEPSLAMLNYAQQRKKDAKSKIQLLQMGVENERLAAYIPTGGFDVIVCTLVLCTTPNPETVVRQLYRWLKPGGKLVALEHIQTPGGWQKRFYQFINPIWKYFGEGCDLTRQTDQYLKEAGFKAEYEAYFRIGLPFYEARLTKGESKK